MAAAVLRGVPCGASAEPHAHAPGRRRRLWLLQASKTPPARDLRATGGRPFGNLASARTRVCKGGNNVVLRRAALLHRAIGSRHGCRSASAPLRGAARHQRGARVRRWSHPLSHVPPCPATKQAKAAARGALHARRLVGRARRPRRGGGATPFANQPGATCATRACKSGRHAPRAASAPRFGVVTKKGSDRPTFLSPTLRCPRASDPLRSRYAPQGTRAAAGTVGARARRAW